MTAAEFLPWSAIFGSVVGPAVAWGMMRQKLNDLDAKLTNTASKESVTGLEVRLGNLASKESVQSLDGRVGELEDDMREARAALSTIPVMDERLKGFTTLMATQMDELRHGLRGVKQGVEGLAAEKGRSRRPAP